MFKKLTLVAFVSSFMGCASYYSSINKENLNLHDSPDSSGVKVEYRFGVLEQSGNGTYANKARRRDLDVVAVKVKNNTDKPIHLGTDVEYLVGGEKVNPKPVESMLPYLRQKSGLYALYLMGAILNIYGTQTKCTNWQCEEESVFIPIGIIIAPALALYNILVASTSNDKIAKDLTDNDLLQKEVKPGEEVSGYLLLKDVESAPLTVKIKG